MPTLQPETPETAHPGQRKKTTATASHTENNLEIVTSMEKQPAPPIQCHITTDLITQPLLASAVSSTPATQSCPKGQEAGSRHHHPYWGRRAVALDALCPASVPRERPTAPSLTPISVLTFASRAGFPSSGRVTLHIRLPKRPEADWANFLSLTAQAHPACFTFPHFHLYSRVASTQYPLLLCPPK